MQLHVFVGECSNACNKESIHAFYSRSDGLAALWIGTVLCTECVTYMYSLCTCIMLIMYIIIILKMDFLIISTTSSRLMHVQLHVHHLHVHVIRESHPLVAGPCLPAG